MKINLACRLFGALFALAALQASAAEPIQIPASMAGKTPKLVLTAGDQVNLYPQGIYCDSKEAMETLKFAYGNNGNVVRPAAAPKGCHGFNIAQIDAEIVSAGKSKYHDAGGWLQVKLKQLDNQDAWIEAYWVKPKK